MLFSTMKGNTETLDLFGGKMSKCCRIARQRNLSCFKCCSQRIDSIPHISWQTAQTNNGILESPSIQSIFKVCCTTKSRATFYDYAITWTQIKFTHFTIRKPHLLHINIQIKLTTGLNVRSPQIRTQQIILRLFLCLEHFAKFNLKHQSNSNVIRKCHSFTSWNICESSPMSRCTSASISASGRGSSGT